MYLEKDDSNTGGRYEVIDVAPSGSAEKVDVLRDLYNSIANGHAMLNTVIDAGYGAGPEVCGVNEITVEAKNVILNEFGIDLYSCKKEDLVKVFIDELKTSKSEDSEKEIQTTLSQFFNDYKTAKEDFKEVNNRRLSGEYLPDPVVPYCCLNPEKYVEWLDKCLSQPVEESKVSKAERMFDLHCKIESASMNAKDKVYDLANQDLVYSTKEIVQLIDSLDIVKQKVK